MKTRKTRSAKVAFVFGEDALQRLLATLAPFSEEIELKVTCSDGSTLEPGSASELLDLPNPPYRKITSLAVSNHILRSKVHADLTLNVDEWFISSSSVTYTLRGEDADVLQLDRDVNDWLTLMRQWYSPIAFPGMPSVMLSLGAWAAGWLIAWSARNISAKHQVFWFSVGLLLQAFAWTNWWIRKKLFPIGVFEIGDGIRRHQALRDFRKNLSLVSIVVGILIGVAATIILKLFGVSS